MKRRAAPRRLLYFEERARRNGYRLVCGIDEAGRGPLAGPVVASAVILKKYRFPVRIDDSKKLTPRQRESAFEVIFDSALIGIGSVASERIDQMNIFQASRIAMEEALRKLGVEPDLLLIDGNIPVQSPHERKCILHGDARSMSIAAASIVAKVTRDRLMVEYDRKYPQYGFVRHKGYATEEHLTALKKYGPSPIHRKTFRPLSLMSLHADID